MEGVGTVPINPPSSRGELPTLNEDEVASLFAGESEEEEDDPEAYQSAGSESGDESDEEEQEEVEEEADSSEVEIENEPAPEVPSQPITTPPAPSLAATSTSASAPATTSTATSTRRGMSLPHLPQFMKRNTSARSTPPSSKASIVSDETKEGDSTESASGAKDMVKTKRKMFSRRRVVVQDVETETASSEIEGLDAKPRRRRGLRRRNVKADASNVGDQSKTGLSRRNTKRDYQLGDAASNGIVQIEIKSAAGLPRMYVPNELVCPNCVTETLVTCATGQTQLGQDLTWILSSSFHLVKRSRELE
jgi:hypothetical protein